ncbi:alpha/beta fold hydrolase [Noviluteimonas gilva]|nr:alpha/beta fold hydrolase [Lysobacter gilvus]
MRLVCLPGLDGTADMFSRFAERAAAHFTAVDCVAYPRDRVMDYAALEAFARKALPASEPFVLLGESFSGPVAMRIAASPPPNLAALVLSTTFARQPMPWLSMFAALTRIAPVHTVPVAWAMPWLLGRWSTPDLRRTLAAALSNVHADVLRARMRAALETDVIARAAAITVPTLVLRATEDRLLTRRAAEALQRVLPNARVVDIAGPHLLLQANADDALRAITGFV